MFIRAFACSLFALTSVGVAAPAASPPPDKIPLRVTIGGIRVGGLTAEPARSKVDKAFDRRLRFKGEGKRWSETPQTVGAAAYTGRAVTRALYAPPGKKLPLRIKVNQAKLQGYAAGLDKKLSRPAVDASVIGLSSSYQPILSDGEPGLRVQRPAMAARIVKSLEANTRKPIPLAVRYVQPSVTAESFGSVIVIQRESRQLALYDGASPWRTFPVAVGQPSYPTPIGNWSIVDMQVDPWWRPPDSEWASGAAPIPPGPGNPLGTRWMGLSAPAVGIHATPDAGSIGTYASHGCIRMYVSDAEWLFEQVSIGTPVFIVSA